MHTIKVESLLLYQNSIKNLPARFGELSVQELSLAQNKLRGFPKSFYTEDEETGTISLGVETIAVTIDATDAMDYFMQCKEINNAPLFQMAATPAELKEAERERRRKVYG